MKASSLQRSQSMIIYIWIPEETAITTYIVIIYKISHGRLSQVIILL